MKKLLLTIAVLPVFATSAAHAAVVLSPTDPLIGNWCEPHVPEDHGMYYRGSECDLVINREGFDGVDTSCIFLEIKKIRNGVEAFSECTTDVGGNSILYSYEKVTFQITGKRLQARFITMHKAETKRVDTGDTHKTMCVEIKPTPDGFLNLRQGPGMKFKVTAKLLSGQRVMVDYQTDEWIHVRSGCSIPVDPNGWVYRKYVSE